MQRRSFWKLGALAGVAVLAGCAVDRGAFPTGSASPSASGRTRTPTPTPTPTPTETTASPSPEPAPSSSSPSPSAAPSAPSGGSGSIDDPASIRVIVNKTRPFTPQDWAPGDLVRLPVQQVNASSLRREAADAVVAMFDAASSEAGLTMASQSAYRSYGTQVSVYNGWVAQLGQEQADLTSARPGTSEHQTGLAIDISSVPPVGTLDQAFGSTPHGQWLAANSWRFGFVVRYPDGYTHITGYEYEPWHFRYVGVELATALHDSGTPTLEQYFGLPAAPDYPG